MDLSSNHFDDYSHNCEYATINMIIIMIKGNYDYMYDYTTNVIILK